MSAPAARLFLPTLREVERQLPVPLTRRVRILRELEYDLEELHARLMDHGLSDEEARRRALEALVPDPASLAELRRLHAPPYERAARRFGDHRLRTLERWVLAGAALIVVVMETLTLLRARVLEDPSPFLWPVLALGGLLFTAVAAESVRTWAKGHQADPRGRRTILVTAATTLFLGVVGVMTDFFRLARTLEADPEDAVTQVTRWLVRDASLLAIAILLALAGALAWFVLTQWLSLVSFAHREVLGLEPRGRTPQAR